MWIYVFLDYVLAFNGKIELSKLFWRDSLKRLLIAASLFVPSLADYCAIVYFPNWPLLSSFHVFVTHSQVVSIFGSLLCSAFDHHIDAKSKLGIHFLEQHTLSILILFNLGNLVDYFLLISNVSVANGVALFIVTLFFVLGN